jgi:rhodanese-related sulfurtransferase
MGIWEMLMKIVGGARTGPAPDLEAHDNMAHLYEPEPDVPEMDTAYLEAALAVEPAPLVLDIREPFEWRQVRMPGALHIPMNSLPDRLDDLPKDRPIVVMCAHGNRSYAVTAYLNEQGFDAHNLTGGITRWRMQGGDTEVGAS